MGKFLRKISSIVVALSLVVSSMSIMAFADDNVRASDSVYLVVNSKTNYMGYYKNGNLVKEFRVSTGKKSTPTPNGKFKIVNKIVNRPYYQGGIPGGSPNNPLGNRWMGLHVGSTYGTTYGVHGNNNENSIGKNITGGCIRMHNSEIRWLYDQVPTGSYVIVDNSNLSYAQIASKYGVKLDDPNELTENVKKLETEFNKFANYNGSINLKDKNSLITNSTDATKILESKANYINAYNKLTAKEKDSKKAKEINAEFNKIISVVEGAQAVLRFYENLSSNGNEIINNIEWTLKLNNATSQEVGTRGNASKEFNEAANYEGITNSKRMSYLNDLYNDSVNFLYVSELLGNKNVVQARSKASQIKNTNLRGIANSVLANYSDLEGHWSQSSVSKAMNDGWVDNSKTFRPDDKITRAEFVKVVNRAFGFTESEPISIYDVAQGTWYYNEVAIAIKQGYIDGYEDGTFRPNENISREEVAKIIVSIMNNADENIDKIINYNDYVKISSWALPYVEGVVEAGYMGHGGVAFRPQDKITRAEAVVTIQRTK